LGLFILTLTSILWLETTVLRVLILTAGQVATLSAIRMESEISRQSVSRVVQERMGEWGAC